MKMIAAAFLTFLLAAVGCKKTPEQPVEMSFLTELEQLPIGLDVIHTPAQVSGPTDGLETGWPHSWVFRTEVRSRGEKLKIQQFGILAWDGNGWALPSNQKKYNSGILDGQTFAEWYGIVDGTISPDSPAVDDQNWAGSRDLQGFKQKWFFIGVDKNGKKWKGEGVVELVTKN